MHDPGDEDREPLDTCPFCGRSMRFRSCWKTVLREPYDEPLWSLVEAKALDPRDYIATQDLVTCVRESCKEQARLMQRESFKSRQRKQADAHRAAIERRISEDAGLYLVVGFKDKDWL